MCLIANLECVGDMEEALKKVYEVLNENVISDGDPVDVVVIMCLHCEMTKLKICKDTGCTIMVPNMELDIPILIATIKSKLIDWKASHPIVR